uniref:Uncharacterized protein n=1 Tax=viral metagenome TaxID=1070528 RepID=A0A6M3LZX9_9ZZZZ
MTTARTYQEFVSTLRAEGHDQADIDAAIGSLIDSGITYADEDELYLTEDEVGVIRDQLANSPIPEG